MAVLTLQPNAAAGIDTIISENSVTANYGVNVAILVGESGSGGRYRGLIKFDLSSLPSGSVVSSAILSLYCESEANTTDRTTDVHRSLVAWFEGVKDGTAPDGGQDGSTWNLKNVNGSVAWGAIGGLAGTDYVTTPISSVSITGTGVFFDFNVTTDVQGFISSSFTNHGWQLNRAPSIVANSVKNFSSSDSATAAQRPKLVITYTNLVGSSLGTSTVTAIIKADGRLAGVISGTSIVVANLLSNEFVRASASGTSTVTATIEADGKLVGAASGVSTAVGDVQGEKQIFGTATGTSTTVGNIKGRYFLEGNALGVSTVAADPSFEGQLRGISFGIATVTGTMFGLYSGRVSQAGCNSLPLLYITNGSIKPNGQLNLLNFLSEGSGFRLKDGGWRPQIAQYKEGGRFSNGPLAQGRRLRYRNFDNVIDTFELSAVSHDQDALIEFQQELLAWQEAAADYWVSDYVVNPIYIVARAARETNTRYAIIHMISVLELDNPYAQPFYSNSQASFNSLTPRIERGHWLSTPPGEFECVPISSVRNWTVSGWEIGV